MTSLSSESFRIVASNITLDVFRISMCWNLLRRQSHASWGVLPSISDWWASVTSFQRMPHCRCVSFFFVHKSFHYDAWFELIVGESLSDESLSDWINREWGSFCQSQFAALLSRFAHDIGLPLGIVSWVLRDVVLCLQFGSRLPFWETLQRLCSSIVKRSLLMILVYALSQALRLSVSPSQGQVIQYWLGESAVFHSRWRGKKWSANGKAGDY